MTILGQYMRIYWLLIFIAVVALGTSCNHTPPPKPPVDKEKAMFVRPSFKAVMGRNFTEVKRVFSNGLRFNEYGYQLEPSWKLKFLAEDSILLYSPTKKRWTDFHVYFDHDSIFNMADNWLKLRKVAKDSIVFQVLSVGEDRHISAEWSNVYMTFYADDVVKQLPKQQTKSLVAPGAAKAGEIATQVPNHTLKSLMYPGPRDTAYILKKSAEANKDHEKAFAARETVDMISNSPMVVVHKVKVSDNKLSTDREADAYLNPEFEITIYHAYRNFVFPMSVYVDENGKIFFHKSLLFAFSDEQDGQNRMMKGVIDGYLARYVTAVAGTTLNIPHTSTVKLRVTGFEAGPNGKK